MNPTDTNTLKKRLAKLKAILSGQYAISKEKRDLKLIADTEQRIDKISSWLGQKKKSGKPARKKPISKRAFKEKLNEVLEIQEAKELMLIDSIEELRAVWPKIRGRNIQIQGPPGVTAAARELLRKDLTNKKKK